MIYLDHNATTPMAPEAFAAMAPWFMEQYGNASSRQHAAGCQAAKKVDEAREVVAGALGADPREIHWTSGATESNNLALLGVARSTFHARRARRIVTVRTEHTAVLDPARILERDGFDVVFLPVDDKGRLSLEALDEALETETRLVSIMHANNETGVLHPLGEIGRRCRARGALFHTDATQAFGKEPIHVQDACIDLLSFSGHKMSGPKGCGGLFVRRKAPRVRCEPLQYGGGHELGLRSGTLNVPGIVGLAAAVSLCTATREAEHARVAALRDRLESALLHAIPGAWCNGDAGARLANTTNLTFPGVDGDALMRAMPDVAVSSASACTSATLQPSYVLGAMGVEEELARSSVRFSLGRTTTAEEIERAIDHVVRASQVARGPSEEACADGA